MGRDKKLTEQEYRELFEKYKSEVLLENEEARQMLKHRPYLFVTSKGRVLSVGKDRIRVLKQSLRAQTYTRKQDGVNEKKHCICINIDGKRKVFYVHLLVAEYFPIDSFVTGDEDDTIIHHIKGYDSSSDNNNGVGNLIRMNQNMHCLLHNMKVNPSESEQIKFGKKLNQIDARKNLMGYKSFDGSEVGVKELTDDEAVQIVNKALQMLKEQRII